MDPETSDGAASTSSAPVHGVDENTATDPFAKALLEALDKLGLKPDSKEANDKLGETRLSARIFELKEKGVNIQDEWLWVKNRYGEKRHVKKYFIGRGRK